MLLQPDFSDEERIEQSHFGPPGYELQMLKASPQFHRSCDL